MPVTTKSLLLRFFIFSRFEVGLRKAAPSNAVIERAIVAATPPKIIAASRTVFRHFRFRLPVVVVAICIFSLNIDDWLGFTWPVKIG
jgi:hypothetical protein